MSPPLALFVFIVGIGVLFFLDRDKSVRTSKAVWLPVIWLWIIGSRPLSVWLEMNPPREVAGQLPTSSLLDQFVAGMLMLFGIIVLTRRQRSVVALMRAGWPVALYFSFAVFSLVWSDFPGWGFKRWVRALGELSMVLIIVTDPQPIAALRRFLSRVGFILIPTSILLIKYFPNVGQGYDIWGLQMNVGVTTNKNTLGVVAFVVGLGTLWQVLSHLIDRKQTNSARPLFAQCVLLCFTVNVLFVAHSATSAASFALGAGLMLATAFPPIRRRAVLVHVLVSTILLAGVLAVLFDAVAIAVTAMGRNADFTGRTPIWEVLSGMAPNPLGGAGFETFWVGERVAQLDRLFPDINEAHNGYLEVYLNLGFAGVGLIALILMHGYRRAVGAFRRDPTFGSLLVAYMVTALTYSVTEAGFRMLTPSWFFLLLAAVAANSGRQNRHRPKSRPERAEPGNTPREFGLYAKQPAAEYCH